MAGILKNDNPPHDLTAEEARKGGINSGIARGKKKTLRAKAELLLSLPIKDKKDINKLKSMGLNEEEIDIQMATLVHMYNIIKKENFNSVGAFNALKDLVDEEKENASTQQPILNINIQTNEKLKETFFDKGDIE